METKALMIGGGVLVAGALFFLWPRAKPTEASGASSGGTPTAPMPMFVSGAGGTILPANQGANPEPLGGWDWQPATPDISNDPNVKIAEINAGVQSASIAAQKEVALATLAPAASSGGTVDSRPASTPSVSLNVASDYLKNLGSITTEKAFAIYDNAVKYGLNKYDVVEAAGRAGIDIGKADIEAFTTRYGLKPL